MTDMIEQGTAPAAPEAIAEPQGQATQDQTTEQPAQEGAQSEAKPQEPRRSRREALEKAFSDMDGDAKGEGGKNADVTEQKADAKQEQPRGQDGKFVAKDAAPDGHKAEKPEDAQAKAQEAEKKPASGDFAEPPARFSADAKAAWRDAPDSVKAEVHRAVREMEQGIEQHRQQIEPIKPFLDMAEQSGTRLEDALSRFVNMENLLRADPVQGFSQVAQSMGMTPQQVGQMLLGQQPGQADPRDQQIMQLQQQLQGLTQNFGQVNQTLEQQREQQMSAQVEAFAKEHPRFDELSPEITRLLTTGYAETLEDAYEKAERLNPAPAPEPEPAPSPAPAQTRQAKSVTGAPSAGSNPAQLQPSTTRRGALERAMNRAGL